MLRAEPKNADDVVHILTLLLQSLCPSSKIGCPPSLPESNDSNKGLLQQKDGPTL